MANTRTTTTTASTKKPSGRMQPKPVAVPTRPAVDTPTPRPDGSYRDHAVLADLPELVNRYRALQLELAALAKLDTERKLLGQEIEALLLAAAQSSVTVGQLAVTRVEVKGRSSISQDLLLKAGVDADVIVAATVVGKPSSHIRVASRDEQMEQAKADGLARQAQATGTHGASWAERRGR